MRKTFLLAVAVLALSAGQALGHRPTSWLRDHTGTVAVSAVAALIAIALIEYYIRGRIVRRRLAQTFAVGKVS